MKKYLVSSATPDPMGLNSSSSCGVYTEDQLLSSDYADLIPKNLYSSSKRIDTLDTTGTAHKWVTVITRIA